MCWCRLRESSWSLGIQNHTRYLGCIIYTFIFNYPFLNLKNGRHPRRVPHSIFLPRHGPGLRTGDFHKCFAFKLFLVSESFLFEWAPNGESVVKIRIGEKKNNVWKQRNVQYGVTLHCVLGCWCVLRRTYSVYWDLLCILNGSPQFKGNSIEMFTQLRQVKDTLFVCFLIDM